MPSREVKIIDGKLAFRGAGRFYGYQFNNEDIFPFDDEGYFITQDLASIEGCDLSIHGRADQVFKSGGENINPHPLEEQLISKLDLINAIVIPIADNQYGNIPAAFLWRDSKIREQEVLHLNQSLPSYLKIRYYRSDYTNAELKPSRQKARQQMEAKIFPWHLTCLNTVSKNRDDLILLHGFMGDRLSLNSLAKNLEQDFNLWSVDLPYHGDHQNVHYRDWNHVIEELSFILQRFQSPWIYGYSMGARLALGLLNRNESLYKKIIIEGANPGLRSQEQRLERMRWDEDIISKMKSNFTQFLNDWYKAPLFKLEQASIDRLVAQTKNLPAAYEQALNVYGLAQQPDYSNLQSHVKLHAIVGEYDDKYRALWPKAKVIKNAAHKANYQAADEIARFVKSLI